LLTMKNGEIACVVGRVISARSLLPFDLRACSKCDPPEQRSTIESIP